ncbi:MAG: DUF6569 family protein [Acidobacteriota bacterium]
MKILTGLLLSILVSGLSLLVLSALISTPAGRADWQPANISGERATWTVGSAVQHENLTIFPVISDQQSSTDEFITLDEGLSSGKVAVTEIGAQSESTPPVNRQDNVNQAQRNRINAPNQVQAQIQQRVGSGGQVNRLTVTNNSGKILVLIAGEIVVGGKQDRIVANDCIIPSTGKAVPIDVFCVEHGRWQQRAAGRDANGKFVAAEGVMAAPKVREKAQARKDQSSVWNEVSDKVAKNRVSTSTGTLNSVYEDGSVKKKLDAYESALKGRFSSASIVGAVVAVGGKIVTADVFANSHLFQAYWPKLLRSYSLEAISSSETAKQQITAADAQAFLSRVSGKAESKVSDGVYRLSENQSDSDASFELEATASKAKLLHFNRVSKK